MGRRRRHYGLGGFREQLGWALSRRGLDGHCYGVTRRRRFLYFCFSRSLYAHARRHTHTLTHTHSHTYTFIYAHLGDRLFSLPFTKDTTALH